MVWTCSSRLDRPSALLGFGVIELLVGFSLAVLLALAVAPLARSAQETGMAQADRTVQTTQARVAIGRFERDTRSAGAGGTPFATSSAILEAGVTRVVLLVHAVVGEPPMLVAWDLSGANLMRRRGDCPSLCPPGFPPSLFSDNKTMLEGVRPGSRFIYHTAGQNVEPPLSSGQMAAVDTVSMELLVSPTGGAVPLGISAVGRVGW